MHASPELFVIINLPLARSGTDANVPLRDQAAAPSQALAATALMGAVLIGLIQAFNEGLTWLAPGSDWTRTIVFGILIGILVFRPEGLLGERTPEGA